MNKQITIGRDRSNTIIINDSSGKVSRNHATLQMESSRIVLIDHSSNGTTVNGRKIHHSSTEIRDGDEILLGNTYRLSWSEIMPFLNRNKTNSSHHKITVKTIAPIIVVLIFVIGSLFYFLDQSRMCVETYIVNEEKIITLTYEQGKVDYIRDEGRGEITLSGLLLSSPKLTVYCNVTNTSSETALFTLTATIKSIDGKVDFRNSQYISPGATVCLSDTKEISIGSFEESISLESSVDINPKTKTITTPVSKIRKVKCKDLR